MKSEEVEKRQESMNDEIRSMNMRDVWKVVKPPKNCRPIDSRWVYFKQIDEKGNVYRFQARLVARGFKQWKIIDYGNVFAPFTKCNTLQLLISRVSTQGLHIVHIDVKIAFL